MEVERTGGYYCAEEERACVTHESLDDSRLAESVVEIEDHEQSDHCCRQKHIDIHIPVEEHNRIAHSSHDTQAGGKAIDSVNKIDRVDEVGEDELHSMAEVNPNNTGTYVTRINTKKRVRENENYISVISLWYF